LRRLLIADAKEVMKKLLKKVPTVSVLHPLDRIRSVLTVMTKYNLYTAAVVDDQKKLVGVVTIDDVMRHLFPEA
jgi:Mg/Co/Ni transporter MgtE